MISLGESGRDKVDSDVVPKKESLDSEIHAPHQTPDNEIRPMQSDHKGNAQSLTPENASQVPDGGVTASQSNQEGSVSSLTSEKTPQTPETVTLALRSGQEGSTPSTARERVLDDGYHWRKYGQKLVKGNAYVRSYYRCTYPKCPVKKQVERTHIGQITDTVYFGEHEHPKAQVSVPVAVSVVVSIVEERPEELLLSTGPEGKSSDAHGHTSNQIEPVDHPQLSNVAHNGGVQAVLSQSNRKRDGDPDSKRQKKEKNNGNSIPVDKPAGEPRLVVQTTSEVDIVGDGYRWRKYGQKLVKGNSNPRSYYRCSSPGCPVKKHVERASHDSKVVISTYEGQHDHDIPPTRTVTHNAAASNVTTVRIGESHPISEGNAVCHYATPEHEGGPNKQLNGEVTGCDMAVDSDLGPETKLNEQVIDKACTTGGSDPADMIVCGGNEVKNGELGSKSEGDNDNLCPESSQPQEKEPKAEPV